MLLTFMLKGNQVQVGHSLGAQGIEQSEKSLSLIVGQAESKVFERLHFNIGATLSILIPKYTQNCKKTPNIYLRHLVIHHHHCPPPAPYFPKVINLPFQLFNRP
jgi:hypothetical protein